MSEFESKQLDLDNDIFVPADGDLDNDGFYFAELNGRRGLVPSNYVITLPNGHEEKVVQVEI